MRVRLKLDRLKELIARGNLSQNHFAIRLGLSRGHWSEIVNGRYPYPSPKTRDRLLELFGVPFDDLFVLEDEVLAPFGADIAKSLTKRYVIDEEIGHGGMGTVYLARDAKLGRQVALKLVALEAVGGIGLRQFLKEIRYSARLNHPNILPVFDAGEAGGQPYYVTPYIKDGSLRDLLKQQGRLTLAQTQLLVGGISAALHHAHENRVLHCDIKPENILLFGDHVYVADFGIARALHAEYFEWERRPELDTSAGTPAYVSPEQAAGERALSPRSDVYSLACVTFEMLTGHPPFVGTTTLNVVAQRFTDTVPEVTSLRPDVPLATAAVIRQAMSRRPQRRQPNAVTYAHQLSTSARQRASTRRVLNAWARITGRFGRWFPQRDTRRRHSVLSHLWLLFQDLRFATRQIRRRPAASLGAILTLALGVGCTVAVIAIFRSMLSPTLGVPQPEKVVAIQRVYANGTNPRFGADAMRAIRDATGDQFTMWVTQDVLVRRDGARTDQRLVNVVSDNFFRVMGIIPPHGRSFSPDPNRSAEVVLSDEYWDREFGRDPAVLGTGLLVDREPATIIGVAPKAFTGPAGSRGPAMWLSGVSTTPSFAMLFARTDSENPLPSPNAIQRLIHTANTDDEFTIGYVSLPETSGIAGAERGIVVTGASATTALAILVVLIACANVANALLASGLQRREEYAVRAALGASRQRLVRQALSETLVLGSAAAVGGLVIAHGLVTLVPHWLATQPNGSVINYSVGWPVAVFGSALTILTTLAAGLLPALRSAGTSPIPSRSYTSTPTGRRVRIGEALVVGQVALSVTVVVLAALFSTSIGQLRHDNLGYEEEDRYALTVRYPLDEDPSARTRIYRTLVQRLREIPGVASAGLTAGPPWSAFTPNSPILRSASGDTTAHVAIFYVDGGYFGTVATPVTSGRSFFVDEGTERVAVVNTEAARRLWPNDNPLGQLMYRPGQGRPYRVVGIAESGTYGSGAIAPVVFLHADQVSLSSITLLIQSPRGLALTPEVADVLRSVHADLPYPVLYPIAEWFDRAWVLNRAMRDIARVLGALALVISAFGIYAKFTQLVSERSREIGIRRALGASVANVTGQVLRRATFIVVGGFVLGAALVLASSKLIGSFLVGVSPTHLPVYAYVFFGGLTVAFLATLLPMRQASAVNPTIT